MQIVSLGEILSNPVSWGKKKKNQNIICWKFYPEYSAKH